MVGWIDELFNQKKRREKMHGRAMPIRVCLYHGHLLDEEAGEPNVQSNYSYLGRLKGLAELRGAIHAIPHFKHL